MEYLSLCRICLNDQLGDEYGTIFDICEDNFKFSDILLLLAPQVDLSDDNLTKIICNECKNFCHEILKFRHQIVSSNDTLLQPMKKEDHFEEIIAYPLEDETKLEEDSYTLVEIHDTSEPSMMLDDFVCDEMIVEVGEDEDEEEEEQELPCPKCKMYFKTTESLENHLKDAHKSRVFECKTCSHKFSTLSQLTRHDIVHSELVTELKTDSRCMICVTIITDKSELDDHMRDHKMKMENQSDPVECHQCKKSFDKYLPLIRHLKFHDTNKTHRCSVCFKTFTIGPELIDHLYKHKATSLHVCNVCGKSYNQASRLKIHLESHSDEKSYLCTECGKSFNRSSNLRQHLLRHAGIKRYSCPQCPSKFVSKGNLKAHMTTHSNKKRFECSVCGSSFTQSYSLVKHNRIHSGERPFSCDVCEMRFYSSDHLKRHVRTHTGERPYKCPYCSKSFVQNGDLNKHKRLHIGEKTYICEFQNCNQAFRLLSELREHHKIHYSLDSKSSENFMLSEEIDQHNS